MSYWYIGVIDSFVGGFLTAWGYALQRLVYTDVARDPSKGPAHKDRRFLLSFAFLAFGQISTVANQGLLSLVAQAPMPANTLLWNALLSVYVLGEKFHRHDVIASCMILVGVIVAVCFTNLSEQDYDLDQITALCFTTTPLAYTLTLFSFLITINWTLVRWPGGSVERQKFALFCYTVTGGLMAGVTHFFMKAAVMVVIATFGSAGWSQWTDPVAAGFVICIPFSLSVQLWAMNRGLRDFSALLFIPIYTCFIILGNLLAGSIYYKELSVLGTTHLIFFPLGIATVIVGVALLAVRHPWEAPHMDDDECASELSEGSVSGSAHDGYNRLEDGGSDEDVALAPSSQSPTEAGVLMPDLIPIAAPTGRRSSAHSAGSAASAASAGTGTRSRRASIEEEGRQRAASYVMML